MSIDGATTLQEPPGDLVYGIFPHEGIVVLRRLPDGTLLDHDNSWVEQWEAEYEDRMSPLPPELAAALPWSAEGGYQWVEGGPLDQARLADPRDPYAWIRSGEPAWDRQWSTLSTAAEVVFGEAADGSKFRRIPDYQEEQLIGMARGAGLSISRDDRLVDAATTRVFSGCSCSEPGAIHVNLSTGFSMVSSVEDEDDEDEGRSTGA